MRKKLLLLCLSCLSITACAGIQTHLKLLQLPPGFHISIYAKVPNARSMTLGNKGTVFVGTRTGEVYALLHKSNNFHRASKVVTLASGLYMPNGVAFRKDALYVAEVNRLLRFDNIESQLYQRAFSKLAKPTIIHDHLPSSPHHGWRYIAFGPDGLLYIAVGAPCNVCLSKTPIFATIVRMQPDGKHTKIFASGIRNSVGFDWDPRSHALWFTDNGRDWMGDNTPPDELNVAPHAGMDFGFPYFYGNHQPDPHFAKLAPKRTYTSPALALPAHVAALGMRFYTGKQFPNQYHQQIFLAEHGSWNRSSKVGYQVRLIKLTNGKPIADLPFIQGWLQGQKVWGRPVDVLVLPDGSLLVSDDFAGVVYRVTYPHRT